MNSEDKIDGRPTVAIVILTYNQKDVTLRCLRSLASVSYSPFEIIVVDNASADGTGGEIRKRFPSVQLITSESNRGCSGGRNLGIQQAIKNQRTDYLLMLDNDTEVESDFLHELVAMAQLSERAGVITGKLMQLENPTLFDGVGNVVNFVTGKCSSIGAGECDNGQYDEPAEVDATASACHFVPVNVMKLVGGYDEAYFPYGYEDMDFCLRVREHGYRILTAPKSVVYHLGSQTLGAGNYVSAYTEIKGKLLRRFLRRHARPYHRIGFYIVAPFLAVGTLVRAIRSGDPKAALSLFRSYFSG